MIVPVLYLEKNLVLFDGTFVLVIVLVLMLAPLLLEHVLVLGQVVMLVASMVH
jgi:hypothetical protein